MLKLMYITNIPEVAKFAEEAGVDRIMVDMEYIGKAQRQYGMGAALNHHTFKDIKKIRETLKKAELVVRCNPIHEELAYYPSSEEEIEKIAELGPDLIMLPYFKSAEEVRRYIGYVNGRAKIYPLLETSDAADCLEEILALPGIDEMHIGLNDLGICYGKKFLFQVLADGIVEEIAGRIKKAGLPFGFGGIGIPGKNILPAEYIIREHYRLGSDRVILSRAFCNTDELTGDVDVRALFQEGVRKIRKVEEECISGKVDFEENAADVRRIVSTIVT